MLRDMILKETELSMEELTEQKNEIVEKLLLEPEEVKTLKHLGLIYFYKKKFQKALKVYEKIEKLEPNDIENKGILGYLNYELGNYGKAIEYFNDFLDNKPDDAFIYFLLGNAYSRSGNIVEAVESYEFAIFLDLDIYKAHLDFAKEYESLGRNKKALIEYSAAFQIDPRDKKVEEKIIELKNKIKGMEKNSIK